MSFDGSSLWAEFHLRPFFVVNLNDELSWLTQFNSRIPCGECQNSWKSLFQQNPPDLSSPTTYFRWGVDRHNDVNAKLNPPKAVLSQDDAFVYWSAEAKHKIAIDYDSAVAVATKTWDDALARVVSNFTNFVPTPTVDKTIDDFRTWTLVSWLENQHCLSFDNLPDKGLVAVLTTAKPDHIRLTKIAQLQIGKRYVLTGWVTTKDVTDVETPSAPQGVSISVGNAKSENKLGMSDWSKITIPFTATNDAKIVIRFGNDSHTCTGWAEFAGFTLTENQQS